MNKIAKVDFSFWVMKICATTLGETGEDILSMIFIHSKYPFRFYKNFLL